MVEALAAAGADLDAVDAQGNTPLHLATDFSEGVTYLAAVEALVEFGARLDIRNQEGRLARDFFYFETAPPARELFKRLAALSPDGEPVRPGFQV